MKTAIDDFETARDRAITAWKRRFEWAEKAVAFWTNEFAECGDTDANKERHEAMETLSICRDKLNEFQGAKLVGGVWLPPPTP